MEILTSKEYAKVIRETVEQKKNREAYEANLIEMGKRSAYEIEQGFKEGKKLAISHLRSTYNSLKEYYADKEGLSFDCFDLILDQVEMELLEEM